MRHMLAQNGVFLCVCVVYCTCWMYVECMLNVCCMYCVGCIISKENTPPSRVRNQTKSSEKTRPVEWENRGSSIFWLEPHAPANHVLDKGIRAISPHADCMMTVWWLCDDCMVTVCWLYVQIGCTQYVASKMQCSSPRKLYQEKGCKTGTEKQV